MTVAMRLRDNRVIRSAIGKYRCIPATGAGASVEEVCRGLRPWY